MDTKSTVSIKIINDLLDNHEVAIFFERIEIFIIDNNHRMVYNRLKIEFIMGLSGIAYMDFIVRLKVFASIIVDNKAIKANQIKEITTINPENLLVEFIEAIQKNIENTPKILSKLIALEGNVERKFLFEKLFIKWNDYENRFNAIPDVSITTLNNLKIQIRTELLTLIKTSVK